MVKQADAGRPPDIQTYRNRFAWFKDRRPHPIDEGKRTGGEKVISPSAVFTARPRPVDSVPRFIASGYRLLVFGVVPRFLDSRPVLDEQTRQDRVKVHVSHK